jgi:hypothetical protein
VADRLGNFRAQTFSRGGNDLPWPGFFAAGWTNKGAHIDESCVRCPPARSRMGVEAVDCLDGPHARRQCDRAMLDPAIDSKLRRCDAVEITLGEVVSGGRLQSLAIVIQQKTGWPIQFEINAMIR